jgi:hypothetical protein
VLVPVLSLSLLPSSSACAVKLPLGDRSLPESRTTSTVAPGVTLTTITRGRTSATEHWTLRVMAKNDAGALKPLYPLRQAQTVRSQVEAALATLQTAKPSVVLRQEKSPTYSDYRARTLGYSVRVGTFATRDEASKAAEITARLKELGYSGSAIHTGEDGDPTSGPWVVRVLTIDPKRFTGEITTTRGANIATMTKVSELAKQVKAEAAVNGGFFVQWAQDGTPGEPAGLSVDHGTMLSEATNGRVTMALYDNGRNIRFQKLTTKITLSVTGRATAPRAKPSRASHVVDGINRPAGKIRNCGGIGDVPIITPRHDFTCTDADEIVVITPEFGATRPSGEGAEAVLDGKGKVIQVLTKRGDPADSAGKLFVQATGADAEWLTANLAVGRQVAIDYRTTDERGRAVKFAVDDSVVNGGPGLVSQGQKKVQAAADGLAFAEDPGFLMNWAVRRNPRTMAGVDGGGKILLVAVDGHQPGTSLGLSVLEEADVMKALGAVEAMNLDGGGSTAMAINGELVSKPSDPTGERAIGDAVVVKAAARH